LNEKLPDLKSWKFYHQIRLLHIGAVNENLVVFVQTIDSFWVIFVQAADSLPAA
jgi:hypothetical protein